MVYDLIEYCHIQGKIAVAYGDAGTGKTMAIKQYQKKHPDGAIVITVSPCFASITGVNELIAEQLKIREKIARKIYGEAVAKLKGSNKVLIIDEAQHLTVRVINHLRCMSDESGIGIAFVGNEEIYLKMKGSGQASYAQLYSRIANNKHVLTSQITKEDIALLFEDSAIEEKAIEQLLAISRTNYGIRGAVNVFVNTAGAYGKVDKLPEAIRKEVENRFLEGHTYEEIAAYLKEMGHNISKTSIHRYGKPFLQKFESVRLAKEFAQLLAEDNIDRPTTELHEANNALISQMIMEALISDKVEQQTKLDAARSIATLQRAQVQNERLKLNARKEAGAVHTELKKLKEQVF